MTQVIEDPSKGPYGAPSLSNMQISGSLPSLDRQSQNSQRNHQSLVAVDATASKRGATSPGELISRTKDLGVEELVVDRADMPENLLPLEHVGANKKSTFPLVSDPDTYLPMRDSPSAISFRGPSIYDPDSHIPTEVRRDVKLKSELGSWIDNPGDFLPRSSLPSGNQASGQYVGDPEEYLPEYP